MRGQKQIKMHVHYCTEHLPTWRTGYHVNQQTGTFFTCRGGTNAYHFGILHRMRILFVSDIRLFRILINACSINLIATGMLLSTRWQLIPNHDNQTMSSIHSKCRRVTGFSSESNILKEQGKHLQAPWLVYWNRSAAQANLVESLLYRGCEWLRPGWTCPHSKILSHLVWFRNDQLEHLRVSEIVAEWNSANSRLLQH